MRFRGEKINHIWKVSEDKYIEEFFNNDSKETFEALLRGDCKIYNKIDGSCGAILQDDNKWVIYQRYFDYKNKFKKNLPEGYLHVNQKYYLKKMERYAGQISKQLYQILDNHSSSLVGKFYSIELVGPNFNRTPNVIENNIALHVEQVLEISFGSIEQILNFLKNYPTEGLILFYNKKYWKIHSSKMGIDTNRNYIRPKTLK